MNIALRSLGAFITVSLAFPVFANDSDIIRAADMDWAKSSQDRSVDTWVAHYASDAVVLSPNQPAAMGDEAIRKTVGGLLSLPGLTLDWRPLKVEVSRSGDMGYLHGTYELSFDGPNGTRIADHGKYVEVWKKQPDGSWKCVIDMFNTDVAPAQ